MEGFLLKLVSVMTVFVAQINSVSITGPPLTRYDPCALGVIHFDKISLKTWKVFLNLGLYPKLDHVEIDISFQDKVQFSGVSKQMKVLNKSNHNFVLKLLPKGNVTRHYIFNVAVIDGVTTVPIVTQFMINKVVLCNDSVKTATTVDSQYLLKDKEDSYQHICGRRSREHSELITISTNSRAGDWPWHVALFVKNFIFGTLMYKCGGSIISKTAILTAGHCVIRNNNAYDPRSIKVVAGVSNYSDLNEVGRQEFTAKKIIFHPTFDDNLGSVDLAVLIVNKIKYTEYVQPVCLWAPSFDKTELVGKEAMIAGYGRTENGNLSEVLRSTYTTVQADTTCINYSPSYKSLLYEFTFCAGYGPEYSINPRKGDSGGGLVLPITQPDHKISWFLRGVLSRCMKPIGAPVCDPKYYVIYTDVAHFIDWLCKVSGLHEF